jgi:ABC-type branched-subunit amino acid transport system ATPase component
MPLGKCLTVTNLARRYGAVWALNSVSLEMSAGERRAIIGPNGAGKTTLFNLISGQEAPTSGTVQLFGENVSTFSPELRARRGVGRTFQRAELFPHLTPMQSVVLAVQRKARKAHLVFRSRRWEDLFRDRAEQILDELGLSPWRDVPVRALSYGLQRKVDIAMSITTEPSLLLLDEPTAGLSPAETVGMQHLLQSLSRDVTLMIIEHDMDVVFAIADHITVLSEGRVFADGSPADIRSDPRVKSLYLGSRGR